MPRATVFLGLGSNLGDREAHLRRALARLAEEGVSIRALSSLFETEPVGGPPQGWFLNAVARGETEQAPEGLLAACLAVEAAQGRVRDERNGPRTVDLDILFYGDLVIERPSLVIPHPRLGERRFVLEPLAELAPDLRHPVSGLTVRDLLARCPDTSDVRRHPESTRHPEGAAWLVAPEGSGDGAAAARGGAKGLERRPDPSARRTRRRASG
jgi:2-amino-4-hydroxy-6-hydroxymethyldihydropteridine diphosphokinase